MESRSLYASDDSSSPWKKNSAPFQGCKIEYTKKLNCLQEYDYENSVGFIDEFCL